MEGRTRLRVPLVCTLCKTEWNRMESAVPPCSHSEQEWEQHYAAVGDRRHWRVVGNLEDYFETEKP